MKGWFVMSLANNLVNGQSNNMVNQHKNKWFALEFYAFSGFLKTILLLFLCAFMPTLPSMNIWYGAVGGLCLGIYKLCYIHQRESSACDLFSLNITTIMCIDLYINGNGNGFPIIGTCLITVGKLLIDNVNIDQWFININANSANANLQEHLLPTYIASTTLPIENNLCPSHKLRLYKRSNDQSYIMLLGVVFLNLSDYTSKINIKREADIIPFLFLASIVETSIISVYYYQVIQHYDKIEDLNAIQKPKVSFVIVNILELLKSYSYIYSISFAPNIGYAKSVMAVWMVINETVVLICKSNSHPDDDIIMLGCLIIIQGCVFILPFYF